MTSRTPFIAGNWKMFKTRAEAAGYVDALAPSNFLATKPQVLRETLASGGQNLVRALKNLLAVI